MKKGWQITSLLVYLLFCRELVYSIEDIPPCYKDLETNFFKYETVVQAFSMHRIGQSQWSLLMSGLRDRSREVPDLVLAQARQMRPNPLEQPFQIEPAVDILKNALYLVFRQVMLENFVTEVTNEVAIKEMFNHIWMSQHRALANCLGDAAVARERITE